MGDHYKRKDCRICHDSGLVKFFSLGMVPLAGEFLKEEDVGKEKLYPLDVYFCNNCSLVQLLDVVSPDILFRDYRYLSSVTSTLSDHFKNHAKEVVDKYKLAKGSFVVEIGSNDGVLLAPIKELGMNTLGFEPAKNIADVARSRGLEVVEDFFTEEHARKIAASRGKAKIILANNVFAHIDDLDDVMRGISELLSDDGVFIFEAHYIVDLIQKVQYDMIYHEHLCYYSIKALDFLMKRFGMEVFYVKRVPIHGGSISVHARKIRKEKLDASVGELLAIEESLNLQRAESYRAFGLLVERRKDELVNLLKKLKSENKKIAGYGASGRGTIILNYSKIGKDILDYLVDASPERYGRYMPGVQIQIFQVDELKKRTPDYVLMIAWAYSEEILRKEEWFSNRGGKFILPLPEVKII